MIYRNTTRPDSPEKLKRAQDCSKFTVRKDRKILPTEFSQTHFAELSAIFQKAFSEWLSLFLAYASEPFPRHRNEEILGNT